MFDRLRWFKSLFRDLPRQLQLAYCLVRDPRVPIAPKVGVLAALGIVVTPIINAWAEMPAPRFPDYAAGSWGPEEGDALMEREGRRWRRI